MVGCPKSTLKPFSSNIKHLIKIDARNSERRYLEVYDRFSLLYFNIQCIEYDVSIRFFYLGDFGIGENNEYPRLMFSGEKK